MDHLLPIVVTSVAAAAAILADLDDEAQPQSRQGQGPRERQERTPTYLAAGGELVTCAVFRDLASHGARVFRRRSRVSSERFLRLVKALVQGDHQPTATKVRLF